MASAASPGFFCGRTGALETQKTLARYFTREKKENVLGTGLSEMAVLCSEHRQDTNNMPNRGGGMLLQLSFLTNVTVLLSAGSSIQAPYSTRNTYSHRLPMFSAMAWYL